MTTTTDTAPQAAPDTNTRNPPRYRAGWRIVAAKEFADSLRSVRFVLLLALIGLAGLASVHAASGQLRDAAAEVTEVPSIFLALFTIGADRIPSFVSFLAFLAPLLGIALGFDAISSERSQRTLARIIAQPIHRDDLLNGKLAGGLAATGLAVACTVALVTAWGLLRLGITPTASDLARLAVFTAALIAYVGLWLTLAIAASVILRRAATAALAVLGVWLVVTVFSGLLTGVIADLVHPSGAEATQEQIVANARLELRLSRLAPNQVFEEISSAVLNPLVRTTGIVDLEQVDRAVPSPLAADQSILLIWPQLVGLITAVVVIAGAAYIAFLRQEVRA